MAGRWSEYELRVRGHALETEELATLGAMGRVPCFPTRHYDGSVTCNKVGVVLVVVPGRARLRVA